MTFRRDPIRLLSLFILLVTALVGCSPCGVEPCAITPAAAPEAPAAAVTPAPDPVKGAGPWNLTLFHINDMHTAFLSEPATWRDDRAEVGGVVALQSHLDEQRATAAASLTLDAGDFMTGNPVGEFEVDGLVGGGWIAMLNALDIDAGVIGNHDFDMGRPSARALAAAANWPVMALDLHNEQGELELAQDPVIFERNGLRVGVIGVTCRGLFGVVADSRIEGLQLVDQVPVVRRWAAELDPVTDLLVVVTHNGINGDEELARAITGSGVDVIVGGHSHTRTNEPRLVEGVLIVQAGGYVKNLGRLDLQVADDRVVSYDGRLIQLTAAGRTADPELTALADAFEARVDEEYGREIGRLLVDWKRDSRGESNVGSWICDAMLKTADADVAVLNSGTLRKNYLAGPLSRLDIVQLVPFNNLLEVFELDGAGLERICLANAEGAEGGHHGILQLGGLRYVYTVENDAVRMLEITVGGQPLERERVYTVTCPDFVAMKYDIYLGMDEKPATHSVGVTVTEAIIAAVEAAGDIDARTDGRMARK